MKNTPVPAWFENCVLDGLSMMFTLSLQGTPPEEGLEATAKTWGIVLWNLPIGWEKDADIWRFQQAFISIMGRIERFPAPKNIIDHMPARKELVKIGKPEMSEAEREENKKKLSELLSTLGMKVA